MQLIIVLSRTYTEFDAKWSLLCDASHVWCYKKYFLCFEILFYL